MKARWDFLNANRYPPKGIRSRVWVVGSLAERKLWLKGIGA